MIEPLEILIAFTVGVLLGLMYFGGLSWTVGKFAHARNPIALYLVSFGVRMTALLLALFVVLKFGIAAILTSLLGIIVVRFVLTAWFSPRKTVSGNGGDRRATMK